MRSGSPLLAVVVLLIGACSAQAASDAPLERGIAIIDPGALRELDHGRLGLMHVMMPWRSDDRPLANEQLFALPSMMPVRKALDTDFERYVERHQAELPNESIGVGAGFVPSNRAARRKLAGTNGTIASAPSTTRASHRLTA